MRISDLKELSRDGSRLFAAQVESLGINGLALARGEGAIGFRVMPLLTDGGRFDGKLVICALKEMGPFDPDGRYNHISFRVPLGRHATQKLFHQELFWGNGMVVCDLDDNESATMRVEWGFDGVAAYAKVSSDREVDVFLLMNGCVKPAKVVEQDGSGARLEQAGLDVWADFTGNWREVGSRQEHRIAGGAAKKS